ncbi:oxidoreductase [Nocardia sp. CDC160]|uniref:oxidoreductase n=1 Tax=Nocardia sp. CDC160 TaxID=3112166 RepID=UPI002DB999D9|nr:oxidoreductase [Nocardia sp. CDC160]MEC3915840.1 oxidoreductase [Nocardia sp. CDC160]
MAFLDLFGRGGTARRGDIDPEAMAHLTAWTRNHYGVEAFVEPRTTVSDVSVMLVAHDGEWTRRVVGERGAQRLSAALGIPVYDARRVGYPQRMRDYESRRRILERRAAEWELSDDTRP